VRPGELVDRRAGARMGESGGRDLSSRRPYRLPYPCAVDAGIGRRAEARAGRDAHAGPWREPPHDARAAGHSLPVGQVREATVTEAQERARYRLAE
jgi:hypothetical protein